MPRVRLTLILAMIFIVCAASAAARQAPPSDPNTQDMAGSMAGPLGVSDDRHASGTAWMPDDSPMRSAMLHKAGWMLMAHGQFFGQFITSSSDRGDRQFGSVNWLMTMARHDLAGGELTARGMFSLERLTVGVCGYPDLAQSVSNCGTRLRDLQHPHDLFMELGADYRRAITDSVAIELYGGPAGEPALGPAAYPHRLSALPNPIAPISHHWLDITHISFGVVTGGVYGEHWKAEASAFNGRHSDNQRYGFDLAPLNSYSWRGWWLPTSRWSMQVSAGRLRAPELHNHAAGAPEVVSWRTTASATYHRLAGSRLWATTVAWGQNMERGVTTGAVLAETAFDLHEHDTLFGRAEIVTRTALDASVGSLETDLSTTSKIQAGYMRTLLTRYGIEGGIGASVGLALIPQGLEFVYDGRTAAELAVFFSVRPAKR